METLVEVHARYASRLIVVLTTGFWNLRSTVPLPWFSHKRCASVGVVCSDRCMHAPGLFWWTRGGVPADSGNAEIRNENRSRGRFERV